MQKLDTTLSAVVTHKDGDRRIKRITHVLIKMGAIQVATGVFGGTYTVAQALTEYRRNPGRFTKLKGAETLALVA